MALQLSLGELEFARFIFGIDINIMRRSIISKKRFFSIILCSFFVFLNKGVRMKKRLVIVLIAHMMTIFLGSIQVSAMEAFCSRMQHCFSEAIVLACKANNPHLENGDHPCACKTHWKEQFDAIANDARKIIVARMNFFHELDETVQVAVIENLGDYVAVGIEGELLKWDVLSIEYFNIETQILMAEIIASLGIYEYSAQEEKRAEEVRQRLKLIFSQRHQFVMQAQDFIYTFLNERLLYRRKNKSKKFPPVKRLTHLFQQSLEELRINLKDWQPSTIES